MTDDTMIFARDLEDATRLRELLNALDDGEWRAGSAEPWIKYIVGALVIGCNAEHVVEIGAFQGYTTTELAGALQHLPGPRKLSVCEIDEARAQAVADRLSEAQWSADIRVFCEDSHVWIPRLPDASVDFVWLDGNHEKAHVARELNLLHPKMRPGGIICGHDVFGVCDLQDVFARFQRQVSWPTISLDLPRLGPAGGIGIIQRPR